MSNGQVFIQTCEICNKTFESTKRHAQYCSGECKEKGYIDHTCAVCGKHFFSRRKEAIYCSIGCFREGQAGKASERGKEIVRWHDKLGWTFAVIAEEFGISRPRVHQIYTEQKKRDAG